MSEIVTGMLSILLFVRGSYILCFMTWFKSDARFLIVYIECMWTGPGVKDYWDEFNCNVLLK